ncbi:unnamed protein product [Parascedosporium putredinis]|uniref:Rhodopsin domain-containing protein n=1 Tax=Parascedosporium putredinis TaxID=1442378 RepID=A0A9P1GXZ9_9PEZI|nr:unnamed protein product [Parascedosporium putredinis]CAI7990278.1 unnamed protein product [Parascedosporium putredinis]
MASTTIEEIVASTTAAAPAATTTAWEDLPHDNMIATFNGSIWMLAGLSGFFFFLRLYCKITRHRGLWWDDYLMGASWVTIVISCIFGSISTTMGFGKHSWDIDMTGDEWPKTLFIMNMTGFWSIWAAAWSKTSFAMTLLRLSSAASTKIKWFIWFWVVTVNVGLTLAAIFMWTQCTPTKKVWDSRIEGTCWSGAVIVAYNSWISVWSGMADIVLAVVPWWVISRQSMNFKEQIGLLICMSLGIFAGLTSIVKSTPLLNILGIAEGAVCIMAASIPVLRALLSSPNLTKARSQGGYLSHATGNRTNISQARRDPHEVLSDVDSDKIKLTRMVQVTSEIKDPNGSSTKIHDERRDPEW